MVEECGATFGWGMFNTMLGSGILKAAAGLAGATDDVEHIPSAVPGLDARAVRRPVGVVVGMAPWNAPVILAARAVAAPLALGNTVVLKASEKCPRVHAAVVSALHDAGLPAGTINFVVHDAAGAPEVVDALVAHPAVRRVNFTGSTTVGKIIAAKCAEHLNNGLTLLALGLAAMTLRSSRILGWLGSLAGVAFLVEALLTAETGFSPRASTFALIPTVLLIAFLIGAAREMWQGPADISPRPS
jgi:hypothetical protein